jgi:AcrR family transcriptional regulator
MISAAEQLFRVQGLHATGLAEVLERSGAPRGSLYHHFPGGKAELASVTLNAASARIEAALASLVGTTGSVAAALRAYGTASAARLRASDFAEGCPIGNTVLEASVLSPELRSVCDAALRAWEAVIADALVAEDVAKDEAASLGTFVVATFEGALLVARARRSTAPMEDAGEYLASMVEAALNR